MLSAASRAAVRPATIFSFAKGVSHSLPRGAAMKSARLVLVGDVHHQWEQEDALALKHLQPDIALFVGDFGEEVVDLVESIKQQVDAEGIPAAYMLGNHDAWHSLHKKDLQGPDDARLAGAQAQLNMLGKDHVGYTTKRFPDAGISVVGGRPFSAGGSSWGRAALFQKHMYGVNSMHDSADRIQTCIALAPVDDTVVVMAHNGPAGLGSQANSICGKDWSTKAGDHGDPDLQAALKLAKATGRTVPLVVFGHMHHILKGGAALRDMICADDDGTVYLNCAVVPRWRSERSRKGRETRKLHQFTTVDLSEGQLQVACSVWVAVTEAGCLTVESTVIARTVKASDGSVALTFLT